MNTSPIQPDSDERNDLARLLPDLVERDLPSDRQRQLQEFVMSEIQQAPPAVERVPRRAPKRRLVLATSALAAAAIVAAAIGTGGFGLGQDANGPTAEGPTTAEGLSPAARTFELAAVHAAAQPYTPPRSDQWIYIKNRELAPSALAKDKGQNPDATVETWILADGTKMAGRNPETGQLDTYDQNVDNYPALSTLPTDPHKLLSVLQKQVTDGSDNSDGLLWAEPRDDEEWNSLLFQRIASILNANMLPPDVTAALWRAAALIPDATESSETVEIDGRKVIAVGRIQDGWRFEQLLVDPETHEFIGSRSVAVKNFTYTDGPNGPIKVKKGDLQFQTIRLAAKIVDAAGQTS